MEVKDFRVLIKHSFLMGQSVAQTLHWLQDCYPGSAPSESKIRRWMNQFQRGDFSTLDGDRTGRPRESVTPEFIQKVYELVRADRRIKVSEIANILRISVGSVFTILHTHLDMKKLFARWVPRGLTLDQKAQRIEDSSRCLEIMGHDKKNFFRRYVTMDETWIHHYVPESKQQSAQWIGPGETRPKRFKTQTSAGKVLASVFWDANGILFIDYLEHGKTINSQYYIALLEKLLEEIHEKRPGMQRKKILYHQDNAPAHRSMLTMAKLNEIRFELLPHPPYSPDLAPSDYYLFSDLKQHLRGQRYHSNAEVIGATEGYFAGKDKSFFKKGIEMLEKRWTKCITLSGDYVEE